MNNWFSLYLTLFLIAGCQTVIWHGQIEGKSFSVKTVLYNGDSISGAYLECPESLQRSEFESKIARNIISENEEVSNPNGELKISYKSLNVGGEYSNLAGLKFGEVEDIEVNCQIRKGKFTSKIFNLLKLNESKTIQLKNA